MARKNAASIAKKVALVGIPLIIIELGYMFFFNKTDPVSTQVAIEQAVQNVSKTDDRRKALLKIQLSLADYVRTNSNQSPKSLDELRPKYFDIIPLDPATGKPFSYKVVGGRWYVGYDVAEELSNRGSPKGPSAHTVAATTPSTTEPSDVTAVAFIYDASTKRDPFRPFDFAPKKQLAGKTPLERYEYGQLKLTAVLEGMGEPQVIIENAIGRGYTAKKGAKVGPYGGEIVEIQKDRVLILESNVDFTGEKKSKTIELRLRTKDQEKRLDQDGR